MDDQRITSPPPGSPPPRLVSTFGGQQLEQLWEDVPHETLPSLRSQLTCSFLSGSPPAGVQGEFLHRWRRFFGDVMDKNTNGTTGTRIREKWECFWNRKHDQLILTVEEMNKMFTKLRLKLEIDFIINSSGCYFFKFSCLKVWLELEIISIDYQVSNYYFSVDQLID